MANDNYTENTPLKAYEELFCSTDLTQGIHSQLIFLSGLNILFCFTAFFGNAVILVALHKENSLYAPSKLLLRCLAMTDLFVGLIVEPLEVTFWISLAHHERSSICRYALAVGAITGYTLCLVSLFTSTAIAVERLLALSLGLRYRQVVTFTRTRISITAIWIVSIFGSTGYLWSHPISEWYGYIAMGLCLIVSSFSYTKIFITPPSVSSTRATHSRKPVSFESDQYSSIQKGCIKCAVVSADISCLLSTLHNNRRLLD